MLSDPLGAASLGKPGCVMSYTTQSLLIVIEISVTHEIHLSSVFAYVNSTYVNESAVRESYDFWKCKML
jgi:hypothetical protein